ncbi:alkaline phosphatase family protein [Myroides sp. NP-2]|uniref:alkaline phosphatase family protein n=1 Tax=Myroides sp. NP-2 TaxID=2759945 RepID=UPI0015FDBA9A|nr:alkaline phosphatase family protein [Myroides sp. NP-2]MBB1150470.1 alkaline phosphatase family protein [Myroides sp. NP-2]
MNNFYFKQLIVCFALLLTGQIMAKETPTKKVVFIIVDGIAYDMLAKTATPSLDKIAEKGSLLPAYIGGGKDTYTQTPTISAVGYNSLLTGTWVNKHNVPDNNIDAPNYNYPTLFQLVKQLQPTLKTAVFSTWLDNRTKLIGEGLEETNKVEVDYAFDGFEIDKQRYPHDNNSEYIKEIDGAIANRAAEYILKHGPDLSWVYLQYTDDMGHRYGDGAQLYNAITYEDALIGKIYESVVQREKEFNEDWLFVVTTDHGRTASDGKGHGGQSDRERSIWILSNQKDWKNKTTNFTPSIVDIAPSVIDHLGLKAPIEVEREWDGNSMFDAVKIANLKGDIKRNNLTLTWEASQLDGKETAEIWGASSNNKKQGGEDTFVLLGKVNLKDKKWTKKLKNHSGEFYKVYLKSSVGQLNTWIM